MKDLFSFFSTTEQANFKRVYFVNKLFSQTPMTQVMMNAKKTLHLEEN
jgi:hypothetical protein